MQMWSGAHPLPHLLSQQPSQSFLLALFIPNFLAHLQACFPTLQVRKEPFTLFVPQAWVTHSFYQLFDICCSTLNIDISRALFFFLQYQINQVIDKLTNLFAFHGALLWFFVIKHKTVWILPFPSKWRTAHTGTLTLYLLSKASHSLFSLLMTAQGKPQSLGHLEVVVWMNPFQPRKKAIIFAELINT